MSRFWNLAQENGSDVISIDQAICGDDWFAEAGDSCSRNFRKALESVGDVTVRINSPGGEVFAASDMYAAIKAHEGKVTVEITGLAASAASVIAMAGDAVLMAPTATMMIHDPWSCAQGDAADMKHEAKVLDELKESIINAYEIKTGLSRARIGTMMENETWMSAHTAVTMGFADGIIGEDVPAQDDQAAKVLPFRARAALDSTRRFVALMADRDVKASACEDAPAEQDASNPADAAEKEKLGKLAMAARIWAQD